MKKFSQHFIEITILAAGIFLRVYHLFRVDVAHEPFRLGGLFVAFAEQIIGNGYRLPVTIPFYSAGGIPFAYPPLGFYVEALLLSLFPTSRFLIANFLPPIVSVLALVAMFFLLRWHFREQKIHFGAGLFAYAFLPLAFSNQIEAAGVAEAFGSLALVGFFASVLYFRDHQTWKNAGWVGLALALSVLSSPGSAIGATFLSGLLGVEVALKNKFDVKAIGQMALAAAVGLIVSAPYWAVVMSNHGRGIFVLPVLGQYGGGEKQSFAQALFQKLMSFNAVADGGAFFWNLIIFLGLLWLVLRGKFVLPIAFLALFSIPRESAWLTALPAALLFAYGVGDALIALTRTGTESVRWREWIISLAAAMLGIWMAFQSFLLVDALIADQQWRITAEQVGLVEQARDLIPADGAVVVIGNDALLEWSPYLLQREVLNTKFGLEWQPAELEQARLVNKKISEAATWDDVLQAVTQVTGKRQVYILASDKKLLTALSRGGTVSFTLKLETPAIQLGLLGGQ